MSRSPRILIVDDEEEVVELLTQFFTGQGYLVCSTGRAWKSLTLLDEFPDVRVVLLDLGVGGTKLLRKIKEKKPAVEVIIMTGHSDDATLARKSLSPGAFDHVEKPFDPSMLEKLVRAAIKER